MSILVFVARRGIERSRSSLLPRLKDWVTDEAVLLTTRTQGMDSEDAGVYVTKSPSRYFVVIGELASGVLEGELDIWAHLRASR